ncbi:hypothetical protein BGW36DRAFT_426020 [Talaromyces proteolyticus]|uniref:Adhesin n=1 Tax=Talaromyces proteolyticus TaxID=1131652 RepID=A0AAD4Q188_9EURO|nr:uncharacterized protein BGW36DRAFT_426020 [Talaromyces proteolyticus]KAH8698308.1 hypothetical protein BGW36DRAFT_426020 [Talaromyces proteolyticus]
MKSFSALTLFLSTSILTSLASATPIAAPGNGDGQPAPVCGTCNPISGQNSCDPTTSCINTGTNFHCACRAGYKASNDNDNFNQQFRLQMPNYEFLVFTPQNVVCDTLCDNPYGGVGTLCTEVPLYTGDGCTA